MNRLAQLRKEKGLNQIGLALKMNISQYMVSAYETGRHQMTEEMLIKMADFFDVSIDYLIGRSDIRYTAEKVTLNSLTETETEMLHLFRTLSGNKRERVIGAIIAIESMTW